MKAWEHFKTITNHKILVMKGCFRVGLYKQGLLHDLSKYTPTEFLVGCKYFQGNLSPNNIERKEKGFEAPKTVSCLKALEYEEILVGGRTYEKLCHRPMEIEELKGYPLVGLGRETVTYELYRNFFVGYKVDMELDIEVATSDLMLPLLENNFGLGFMPEQMARPLIEEGKLVRIPLNAAPPKRSIQIVADRGRGRSLATGIFYQYLETAGLV